MVRKKSSRSRSSFIQTIRSSSKLLLVGFFLVSAAIVFLLANDPTVKSFLSDASNGGNPIAFAAADGIVQIEGEPVYVEIIVGVPKGVEPKGFAKAELKRMYPQAQETSESTSNFVFNGMVWNTLPVIINYSTSNAPSGGKTALQNAMQTWTNVPTSTFAFVPGEDTDRCPSLVAECPGDQFFDGQNDVGWVPLSTNVYGVAWVSIGRQEGDVALSTRLNWTSNCTSNPSAETTLLHELGHIIGLGHSSSSSSVMYSRYSGTRCTLTSDDIAGISTLYPEDGAPAPTSTPTPSVIAPTATPYPTSTPTPSSHDSTPPTVTITSPTNGQTVKRNSSIQVLATASDNIGIDRVEFYVNGSLVCSDSNPAYSCVWKVTGKPNASHTIIARAYDTAGNSSASSITIQTSK